MVGPNWADLSNVSFASQHLQLAEGDVSYPLALLRIMPLERVL